MPHTNVVCLRYSVFLVFRFFFFFFCYWPMFEERKEQKEGMKKGRDRGRKEEKKRGILKKIPKFPKSGHSGLMLGSI